MTQTLQSHILIIGQGEIGSRVTNQLAKQGYQVTGLARGDRSDYALTDESGFIQADARTLQADQLKEFTHIAIIVTPDQYDAKAYKTTYLGVAQHLASLSHYLPKLERIVFISSTGVYGQDDGEWVDETIAPAPPKREASGYILKAEQALQQAYTDKAIIIRPSGIYGESRLMRVRKALEPIKPAMPKYAWSNRIMDSDLVTIITNVLTLDRSDLKPIYLATDFAPVTSFELMAWLCAQLDSAPPTNDASMTVSGKRLHSNIPKDWLKFADWQSGYRHILAKVDGLTP